MKELRGFSIKTNPYRYIKLIKAPSFFTQLMGYE